MNLYKLPFQFPKNIPQNRSLLTTRLPNWFMKTIKTSVELVNFANDINADAASFDSILISAQAKSLIFRIKRNHSFAVRMISG